MGNITCLINGQTKDELINSLANILIDETQLTLNYNIDIELPFRVCFF